MNLKNLIREKYNKYFFNHKLGKIPNDEAILNSKNINTTPIPVKSIWDENKSYQFDWGSVTISLFDQRYVIYLDIVPSLLFENSEIKHESHISKIEKLSVKHQLIDNYHPRRLHYFTVMGNSFCRYKVLRTAYAVAYQDIDLLDMEISKEPIEIDFAKDIYENYVCMPKDEENFRIYIDNTLIPRIKDDLIGNFKQEIITYNNKLNAKLFIDRINPDVINNAFAFVKDLVPDCYISDGPINQRGCKWITGYSFNIPLKNWINNYGYKLDDNMVNILFEITEGINKLKIGYEELNSYISFTNNIGISISLCAPYNDIYASSNFNYGTSGAAGYGGVAGYVDYGQAHINYAEYLAQRIGEYTE